MGLRVVLPRIEKPVTRESFRTIQKSHVSSAIKWVSNSFSPEWTNVVPRAVLDFVIIMPGIYV